MGAAAGAIVGLLIGLGLSFYVARLDHQKRQQGLRARANYRGSLFVVPAILAVIGGILGGALAG
jgi:ABC-type antimicrobial peptide transport system permease subunit